MRLYICTPPRKRNLIRLLYAAALFALCLRAPGQNSGAGGNTAKAQLHISAIVVPVVLPLQAPGREYLKNRAVIYDLRPQTQQLSISQELRPMQIAASAGVTRQELVRITTVVAK